MADTLHSVSANPRSTTIGWFDHVWHSIRPIIQSGFWVGVVTLMITISLPNTYKSEARVLPGESRGGGGGMAAAAAAAAGLNVPGTDGPDAVYVDILNSRSLREALLRTKFTFKKRNWYFGAAQNHEQTLYEYLNKKNIDVAFKSLRNIVTVSRDIKTKLLTITVETTSPELSQQIVVKMLGLLDEMVVTKNQTRGGAKSAFTEKRLREAKNELDLTEEALRSFLDVNRNYLLSQDPAIRLRGQRLENELRLRTQIVGTLAVGREQALLEEKNDMPILNILDTGNLPVEKSGPPRTLLVVVATILSSIGVVGWQQRKWIRSRLMVE